jgi:hypothetical protein
MTKADIEAAIEQLEAEGHAVSKNAIFRRVGGHRREVLRLADEVLAVRAGAGAVLQAPPGPEASAPAAELYEVMRPFTGEDAPLHVGDLVAAGNWRNLRGLVAGPHPWLRPYVPHAAVLVPADPPAPVVPDQKDVMVAEAALEAAIAAGVDATAALDRARAPLQAWADDQRFCAGLPQDDPWRTEVEGQREPTARRYQQALEAWRGAQARVTQAQAALTDARRLALETAQRAWVRQARPALFAELDAAQAALQGLHPAQDPGEYQRQKWIVGDCEKQIRALMSTAKVTQNAGQEGAEHDA